MNADATPRLALSPQLRSQLSGPDYFKGGTYIRENRTEVEQMSDEQLAERLRPVLGNRTVTAANAAYLREIAGLPARLSEREQRKRDAQAAKVAEPAILRLLLLHVKQQTERLGDTFPPELAALVAE